MLHLIASDHGHFGRQVQLRQNETGTFTPAAGGDRPRHFRLGQARQQLPGAGQRTNLIDPLSVGLDVQTTYASHFLGRQRPAGLSQQSVNEQPAAHTDPSMNAPDRQLDAGRFERIPPSEHVLIDAVHQGAIKVKEKCQTHFGDYLVEKPSGLCRRPF